MPTSTIFISSQSSAVFAFESELLGSTGQRKYLVTTYYAFGQRYLWVIFAVHAIIPLPYD